MARPKGLGKGLGALLPQRTTTVNKEGRTVVTTTTVLEPPKPELTEERAAQLAAGKSAVVQLPLAKVQANPDQPRKIFDEAALDELADSLKVHGVIQPILVRPKGEIYEIIAGERRYRAAQLAGLATVPAIICSYTDEERAEVALIENLQREDLNVVEEARAYEDIIRAQGLTQDQLAQKVGRSRSHIANILRLLRLPQRVLDCLGQDIISMGQARPLLALEPRQLQEQAADYVIDHDLSAREVERLMKRLLKDPDYLTKQTAGEKTAGENTAEQQPETRPPQDIFVTEAEDKLKLFFGTQVHIQKGKKKSCIEIEYYSDEDLNRILEVISSRHEDEIERKKAALRQFSQKLNV